MTTILSTIQWLDILHNPTLTKQKVIDILDVVHATPSTALPCSQIAERLGEKFGTLNLRIGFFGRRVAEMYTMELPIYGPSENPAYFSVPFLFDPPKRTDGLLDWVLRPELAKALDHLKAEQRS